MRTGRRLGYPGAMAKIRGLAFLGTVRYVKQTHGEEMLQKIIEDAGAATRKTFAKRIDGLGLQPYASFVGLLRSTDRHLGTGDLAFCRKLGDLSARADLSTIFRVYTVRPAPEVMIRACTPIWGMYNEDAGYMDAVATSPDNTVLRISGFPDMDPAHCRLMEGWMIAAMDIIGVDVLPGAKEVTCMSTGGPYHEFVCQWTVRNKPRT